MHCPAHGHSPRRASDYRYPPPWRHTNCFLDPRGAYFTKHRLFCAPEIAPSVAYSRPSVPCLLLRSVRKPKYTLAAALATATADGVQAPLPPGTRVFVNMIKKTQGALRCPAAGPMGLPLMPDPYICLLPICSPCIWFGVLAFYTMRICFWTVWQYMLHTYILTRNI